LCANSFQTEKNIRIIGLCTSLANAKDLGEWIGAGTHGLFNFAPGVRPVPLSIHIQGFDIANFEARMKVRTSGSNATVPLCPAHFHLQFLKAPIISVRRR
jgi:replicative superfamily II helicase